MNLIKDLPRLIKNVFGPKTVLTDTMSNPTIPLVGSFPLVYNGSSWDRLRPDPKLAIPNGDYGNVASINKFGDVVEGMQMTPTDIWDRADSVPTQQLWVAPTVARIHQIASSSVNDDGNPEGAGSGAQAVRIYGLTSWSGVQATEDITLNGTSNVATLNDYVIIYRMKVIAVGSTYNINAGIITATADTDLTVTAQINSGRGQTQMAIFAVGSMQILYITCFFVSLHDSATPATAAELDFKLLANERPDLNENVFLLKHAGGIISTANTITQHIFNPYKKIKGPCIVKIQGVGSVDDLSVSAGFDGIIKTI